MKIALIAHDKKKDEIIKLSKNIKTFLLILLARLFGFLCSYEASAFSRYEVSFALQTK